MRRADRLFRLVEVLRRRRITTARQLADELEVCERTVYRDVRDLVLSGVPIEGAAGVGYALGRGFDVPPMMFTEAELEALALGAQVARGWGDAAMGRAAASALAKVRAVLPAKMRANPARRTVFAPAFHVPVAVTRMLGTLRAAVASRERLTLAYRDKSDRASERVVRPLGVFFWGSVWSLCAWCELRRGFRHFRLDRIARAEPTGTRFEPEAGRTLEDFFRSVGLTFDGREPG